MQRLEFQLGWNFLILENAFYIETVRNVYARKWSLFCTILCQIIYKPSSNANCNIGLWTLAQLLYAPVWGTQDIRSKMGIIPPDHQAHGIRSGLTGCNVKTRKWTAVCSTIPLLALRWSGFRLIVESEFYKDQRSCLQYYCFNHCTIWIKLCISGRQTFRWL